MNFGERLTALRNRRGKTQDQMAEILEIKRARYNAWENNISSPSHEHLAALANYHRVTVDFLLGLPYRENTLTLPPEMYADGYTEKSYLEDVEATLENIHRKTIRSDEKTIAAHHDGENWTEEELNEIRRFKEFIKAKRENKN